MPTPDHSLGKRIKAERKAREWSQEDVADRVGVRGLAVGKWERGQANPTTDNRIALAAAFGIDPSELGVSEVRAAPADLSPVLDAISAQSTVIESISALVEDVPDIRARLELLMQDMAVVRAYVDAQAKKSTAQGAM